jgi:CheY-like chemotaxis protein
VISVRDNGIDIAADQLPRIFEMFSQIDHSLEKSQGGLGIGLCLVKRFVELHGGSIDARSDGLGKGSEFVVRLPVVVDAEVPQEPTAAQRLHMKSSQRILIVDDNKDGADSLSMMLKILGNDTLTAYDGEEAVEKAVEFQPDAILLDIGLPKLNGYEACRQIREQMNGKKMLIIAQTGWGQDEDRQRTHDAGFDYHLVKPVNLTDLNKILVDFLDA